MVPIGSMVSTWEYSHITRNSQKNTMAHTGSLIAIAVETPGDHGVWPWPCRGFPVDAILRS